MRVSRVLAIAAFPIALLLLAPTAVFATEARASLSADERSAGLWYADRMKFDEIRASGLTGEGLTIAVIDDAINLDAPELQGANIEVRGQFCRDKATGAELPAESSDPAHGHGTSVVSMLVGNGVASDGGLGTRGIVPDAKILFYAVGSATFDENGVETCEAYDPATAEFESDREPVSGDPEDLQVVDAPAFSARQAVKDGADIVSVSSVYSVWLSSEWAIAQIDAMRAGVPIVAGTPNPTATGTLNYLVPFSLNGVVAVGGVDNDGNVIRGSNIYGTGEEDAHGSRNLAVAAPGSQMLSPGSDSAWGPSLSSGTSLATPLVVGTIALGMEKYPSASAFQVLQAMIRTTGAAGLSEPEWQSPTYGYGIVNPIAMLEVDPTQFPDENPLFIMSSKDPRCGLNVTKLEECGWGTMTPLAGDVWPVGASGGSSENDQNSVSLILILVVVGLGILVAVAVIVPVTVTRARKKHAIRNQLDAMNGSK